MIIKLKFYMVGCVIQVMFFIINAKHILEFTEVKVIII